ncbi:MAG: hypothetical protein KAY56_11210 [Inhella sp.]|nr:hypothetical protein [Inhella sp.]
MTASSGGREPIDFASLAAALLDRGELLVPQWLPGGTQRGHEYVCAGLGGGAGTSLSVNLRTGRWADFATDDRGGDLISLYAAVHGLNNGQAALQLMRDLGWERTPPAAAPAPRPASAAAVDGDPRPEPPPDDGDAARPAKRPSTWRAVVPVPAIAPEPDFKHWHYQVPESTWRYELDGLLYGYVVRFRTSDGGKEVLPHTWCVDESDGRGTQRWHWKQWEEPRPLYVPAALLSADLSLPVVLVEGEKCALAGHQLLGHEFDFVSWPGGSKAWAKARWSWLMGRTVYLWPDVDAKRFSLTRSEREAGVEPATKALLPEHKQPGMQAMVGIGTLLAAEHGCTVFLCPMPLPGAVADGWDLADAIAQGWGVEEVRAFIRGAREFVPPDDAARAKAAQTPSRADAGVGGDAADAAEAERFAWRGHLLTSQQGAVKAVRENVVLALDGWAEKGVRGIPECEGLIAFNEFSNNIEKRRPAPWGSPAGDWLEADELMMGDWLVRQHFMPSMGRQALEEAVVIVARRHAYHPVRKHIEGLRGQWDGVPRLDTWLPRTCLVEDEWDERDPLHRYLMCAGAWFVMGLCARVMTLRHVGKVQVAGPGVKFDYMLVLEGPTGWGKSTLASILGGEYFADTGLDVQHKDSLMNIQGILVYEWGELEQLAKQEIGAVKRFISSSHDRFRATFDRRPAKYPRQVVFVGTTEDATYLLDNKGNRRFWPVRLTRPPDLDWLRENLEQLLAEAVARVDANARFWPNREEQRDLFDPQQMRRVVENAIDSAIRRYLYDENQKVPHGSENGTLVNEVTMQDLLQRIGYTIDKQSDAVVRRAGSVLHMLGWEVRRTSLPGRPRVYMRPRDSGGQPGAGGSTGSATPPPGQTHGEDPRDAIPF